MRLFGKRCSVLALALALFLLPGCTGGNPAPSAPAMGRYVETEVKLPSGFYLILGLHQAADGSLELLGYPESDTNRVYLAFFRSTDGGASWTEEKRAWAEDFNREENIYSPQYAAWADDGTLYLLLTTYLEDGTSPYFLARVEGESYQIYDTPLPYSSDGSGVKGVAVADNGDAILDCWSEFLQVDPATGETKHVYTAATADGGSWNDGWALSGDTLVLSETARIVYYDLNTGKETNSLSIQGNTRDVYDSNFYRVMAFGADGSLYFADPKGLYRAAEGTDVVERLADGSLTTLSAPSVSRMGLVVPGDGSYLVQAWSNQEWLLYSYAYDPDVPTLPDTELTIWSLEDDPLIHQAITAFQKTDPGVHVTYTAGVGEDGSVTRDDAIRTLSTQLLAGKGPDVLVLDGLPMDSYIEKGVLADLSAKLDATDGLLTNITGSLRQGDGAVYAVPAQFQVPLLHGSDAAMDAIDGLTSMADWLEANKNAYRTPFIFDQAQSYLRVLYPPLAATLTGPDGGMDEVKLADFLTQIKRIADLRTDPDFAEEENDFTTNFDFGPLGWTAGHNGLDLGNLIHFQGLYAAWTASDKAGDGYTDTLFGANAFLPVTVLGVSAQSANQDLAWRFMEAVLSNEVQRMEVGKGIPVSATAFDYTTQQNNERADGVFSHYGTTFFDAEGAQVPVAMEVLYPPEAYRAEFAQRIKALDTPILYDETVLQIIIDNTHSYWRDETTLDAAVNAIMSKLKLYETEG